MIWRRNMKEWQDGCAWILRLVEGFVKGKENKMWLRKLIFLSFSFAFPSSKIQTKLKEQNISRYGNCTLLHWILLVSKVVCVRPGNRCFRQRRRLSALSTTNPLLSPSTISSFTISQEDFAAERFVLLMSFEWSRLRKMYMDASTRSAISRAICSVERSRQSSKHSEENWSEVMYRYVKSPKQALPF